MATVPAARPDETPLEYLLNLMRDPATDPKRRDWAAAAAAQYVHPKAVAASSALPPRERERVAKLGAERAARDAWAQKAKVIRAKFGR